MINSFIQLKENFTVYISHLSVEWSTRKLIPHPENGHGLVSFNPNCLKCFSFFLVFPHTHGQQLTFHSKNYKYKNPPRRFLFFFRGEELLPSSYHIGFLDEEIYY